MLKKWIIIAMASGMMTGFGMGQEALESMKTSVSVLGEWTIEVYEPDGSLVEVRNFQNSLVSPHLISDLFKTSMNRTHGGMSIILTGNNGVTSGPCNGDCGLGEAGVLYYAGMVDSQNLVVSSTGSSGETLTLAGSVTATSSDNINEVSTLQKYCSNDIKPSDCRADPNGWHVVLTEHFLTTPLAVTAGQIVQVTVNITFSSAP